MQSRRVVTWFLAVGVLTTSLVCSLLPSPSQIAPTLDPLQATLDRNLTEAARPTVTPTATFTPTVTLTPTITPTLPPPTKTPFIPGGISGSLSFPSKYIPSLRIVAFKTDEGIWKYLEVPQNTKTYALKDLPPGKYQVVAYMTDPGKMDLTYGGGYTKAVLCGLTVKCVDHRLIDVEVKPGQVVRDINLTDWFAPKGTFPKNPTIP